MINKKRFLRTVISLTCIVTLASSNLTVLATAPSSELKKQTSNLENELSGLNSELSSLSKELDEASAKIQKLAEKVEKSKLDLAAAKLNEEIQYEAMSDRIKFMYEGGNMSLLHILFSSENMGDFLNKAEYVTTISNYDRDMLRDFQNVRMDIENKQTELEEQQKELSGLLDTLNSKETALKNKISSTSGKLADYKDQLARAKAAEEALKQAQDNETSGSIGGDKETVSNKPEVDKDADSDKDKDEDKDTDTDTDKDTDKDADSDKDKEEDKPAESVPANVSDVALMAGILQCEAGGSHEGMIAVGTVIMNRVASSRFPNTLKGVVYQPGQFGPVSSGKLARVLKNGPNSAAYAAAKAVLGGERHEKVKNCYYFNGTAWTDRDGVKIGGNVFW